MTRITMAAVVFLLMFPTGASADIYRWVDESGTIHFTDDESNIPDAYRGKSSVTIHEPAKSPEQSPDVSAGTGRETTPASPADGSAAAPSVEPETPASEIEQLKSKIAAKEEFIKYVEERRNLALNPDRRRVLNPGDIDLYNKYKEELPRDQERLRELEPPGEPAK